PAAHHLEQRGRGDLRHRAEDANAVDQRHGGILHKHRVTLGPMLRSLAVAAACLVLCARAAAADDIDASVRQLDGSNYKGRLAAALALSKSRDPRAVIALATALRNDADDSIRRVAAVALEKMIDASTAADARDLG